MKAVLRGETLIFIFRNENGKTPEITLHSAISKLEDSKNLTQVMISYCEGKKHKTISSWVTRINVTLSSALDVMQIKTLPYTSNQWQRLIQQWYLETLTTKRSKASITTRVAMWNKNIKPFLEYIQIRDIVPLDVIIPKMKSVGEIHSQSSFKVSLIGERPPKIVLTTVPEHEEFAKLNLIIPISLSRSDAEYLDEIQFDLERKRDGIFNALLTYWKAIKTYHDFGQNIIDIVPQKYPELLEQLEAGYVYDYVERKSVGKKKSIPPLRFHIAKPNTLQGFEIYLYTLHSKLNGIYKPKFVTSVGLPGKSFSIAKYETEMGDNYFFPNILIENIKTINKIDWCMGVLSTRDISYIVALLMMLNPKFNYESLLSSKITDSDGKPYLELTELGEIFSIEKSRAKNIKTATLDELSLEIINGVMKMRGNHPKLADPALSNRLFLCLNQKRTALVTITTSSLTSAFLTGRDSTGGSNGTHLPTYFPHLREIGIDVGTVSHAKLRATEGVLEWFRTGSVKAASKKIGNSHRVALEHYIPKPLIQLFSTRMVRRFQNLLIVAATYNESYMLEAVDFNSLKEVHKFISDILSLDSKGSSPLIAYLKSVTKGKVSTDDSFNDQMIASISSTTLTALYLYRDSALKSNVDITVLSKVELHTGISPMSLITFANYLKAVLPSNNDINVRKSHVEALDRTEQLMITAKWENIFIKKEVLA